MMILKVIGIAFAALFLVVLFKNTKSEVNTFIFLTAGALILLMVSGPVKEIIDFLKTIADRANIDSIYIGIVLKILAIAYLTSFASTLCKDASADSLAANIDFSGKIMILLLAIPILMAVMNSILQIM